MARAGDPAPPTLEEAGLHVVERQQAKPTAVFTDIGAVVYYLKAVPWQIAGFRVDAYRDRLWRLHQQMCEVGGLPTHVHRQLVVARKTDVPATE